MSAFALVQPEFHVSHQAFNDVAKVHLQLGAIICGKDGLQDFGVIGEQLANMRHS